MFLKLQKTCNGIARGSRNVPMLGRAPLRCGASERGQQVNTEGSWIFQANPPRGHEYTMLDVRDAVEACSAQQTGADREQCFLNFGLNAEMVDQYYEPVMKMEESLQDRTSEEDALAQRMVRVAGFLLFLAMGYKVM